MEMNMDMNILKVGGCVRDQLLGLHTKDIDFVVTIDADRFSDFDIAFAHMADQLHTRGFRLFELKPEHGTIRAQFPPNLQDAFDGVRDADFVLSRKDGPYSDGRRPDWVEPGTLLDDLGRRDFTVNAIAQDFEGNLIDPFDGQKDLASGTLRFVGNAMERITQDPLRVIRALRFEITKPTLKMAGETWIAITDPAVPDLMMASVAEERRIDELSKMFDFDTPASLKLLNELPDELQSAIFSGRVRLTGTLKQEKK